MADTIQDLLRRDKAQSRWSYNQAARILDTTAQSVQRWMSGEDVPDRRRVSQLARFLECSEEEVRDAMEESESQRQAARSLAEQIDVMRAEQRVINDRMAKLETLLDEILVRLPPRDD